jgi:hypothetical protein
MGTPISLFWGCFDAKICISFVNSRCRTKRTIHKRWQLIRGLKNVDNEGGKGRGKEGREEGRKEGRGERE